MVDGNLNLPHLASSRIFFNGTMVLSLGLTRGPVNLFIRKMTTSLFITLLISKVSIPKVFISGLVTVYREHGSSVPL